MTSAGTADVVIVGGGVVGSASAWRLRQDGFTGRIVVVDRDPTYARASSFLAMGGIRQQFGSAVCVQMVQHSVRLWREFDERMRTPAHTPRAWFRQRGYLFLADDATSAALTARADAQAAAGAAQRRLSVDEIAAMVPGLALDDIRWGLFGPDDGYANPREVLFGLRAAAIDAGAEYLHDEVVGVGVTGGRVTGVQLAEVLSAMIPDIKVLFVSGHSNEFISSDTPLTAKADYLQKPYLGDALAAKIREVLAGGEARLPEMAVEHERYTPWMS